MERPDPSTHGPNGDGRDTSGRFTQGNRYGGGNPLAGQAAKLRAALFKAVKVGDVKQIIKAMVAKAVSGDTAAAKLVLSYTLGSPEIAELTERIGAIERTMEVNER